MKLVVLRAARKSLEATAMPRIDADAIVEKMKKIAADPFADHSQAGRLSGSTGYRLRHGVWRALYIIDREKQTVILENVKHRREVYR